MPEGVGYWSNQQIRRRSRPVRPVIQSLRGEWCRQEIVAATVLDAVALPPDVWTIMRAVVAARAA